MIELAPDHYAIVNTNGKNKLMLITSASASTVTGFLDEDLQKDDVIRSTKVDIINLVALLGKTPKIGSAYGCKIEPFMHSEDFPMWGTISYHIKITKREKRFLHKALQRTKMLLDDKGLAKFVPLNVSIRPHNGKHLGYYKHSKKEGVLSTLCLKPPVFEMEDSDLDMIIYHEAAHALWYTSVDFKTRALWYKIFEERVTCKKIKQKDLDVLLNAIYEHDGSLKDYYKNEASDHDQIVIKACLTHMQKLYKLSLEDVDILVSEDNIDDYWPTHQEISRVAVDISSYGATKPIEFFAEAISYHLSGIKVPKDVRELIKLTFSSVQ